MLVVLKKWSLDLGCSWCCWHYSVIDGNSINEGTFLRITRSHGTCGICKNIVDIKLGIQSPVAVVVVIIDVLGPCILLEEHQYLLTLQLYIITRTNFD